MSIKVEHITKVYGEQKAVNDISFEVQAGEIIGFLGPNGAGKSTTMKILTCFIPQTGGKASVCGFDTEKQSMDVRKNIGYLPEHNPLYPEMYVKEYLEFAARLHNMKSPNKRIEEMIAMTGLTVEQKKKIGQLSKGYRQRVGLAQAMLHDPKVLIMDEPTSGLDPNQLAEIRSLIKNIGKEKIVADDTVEGLKSHQKGLTLVQVEFKESIDKSLLSKINGIHKVTGDNQLTIEYSGDEDIREILFRFAVENKYTLLNLNIEKQSLEDVFQQVTGK